MTVPSEDWTNGGCNSLLPGFRALAAMLGVNKKHVTIEDLQSLYERTGSAKVFADNVAALKDAATPSDKPLAERIAAVEAQLGLTQPIPFRSLKGEQNPATFRGVAIWPAGTANWTELRHQQILTAAKADATFERIICLGSSRVCNSDADKKHPDIVNYEGKYPTEREFQKDLIPREVRDMYHFPELPKLNGEGKLLSLEEQLIHLVESGQYGELIDGANLFVPSTPNSLYVPLLVSRILWHPNVWFSQAGAAVVGKMPDYWWPNLQYALTLPSGMIRLWRELMEASCTE